MIRHAAVFVASLALSACTGAGNGGAAGTSSGAASPSGGSSVGTSGGTSSRPTTGGTGSRGSSSASSGGSTGAQPPCMWVNDACVAPGCKGQPLGEPCALQAGGVGACFNGTCVLENLQNDPQNCGAFGVVCPGGFCEPTGQGRAFCPGECLPGACSNGLVCDDSIAACVSATCSAVATAGEGGGETDTQALGACCGSSCVEIQGFDSSNCGGCGLACGSGEICAYGFCIPSADCSQQPGLLCGLDAGVAGMCCAGSCVDINSDPHNCYTCGYACPSGSTCSGGSCVGGAGAQPCAGDGGCDPGYACGSYGDCGLASCGPGSDTAVCAHDDVTGECCGQACVDTQTDSRNCGNCGMACAASDARAFEGPMLIRPLPLRSSVRPRRRIRRNLL